MGYFISFSAFPCGTFSVAPGSFSVAHTKGEKWFVWSFLRLLRGINSYLLGGGCGLAVGRQGGSVCTGDFSV